MFISSHWDGEQSLVPPRQKEQKQTEKHARLSSSTAVLLWLTLSCCQTCTLTLTHTFSLLHFPKLPKLAKASCLGGTTAGVTECARPIPTPGAPMPAIPPIITGVVMPIFMLMFIPIMPWFTGIPPIPIVPVVIEGGIPAAKDEGMPVATDAGMPTGMALPAIMGLAGGLMGVTWGGELRFSPPKFWANRLTGGTPTQTHEEGGVNSLCFTTWIMKAYNMSQLYKPTYERYQ